MEYKILPLNLRDELIEIEYLMYAHELPINLISDIIEAAMNFKGVYELVKMWADETCEEERNLIIKDLQDLMGEINDIC